MKNLHGKTAVVTGAASGIGRACALEFAREGMKVVVADLNEPGLKETVEMIRARGATAVAKKTDVARKDEVKVLIDFAIGEVSGVDLLMNNAGVAMIGEVRDLSLEDDWEWVMGVNLWGPIYGCHYVLSHMIERGSGHIVNTSSAAGLFASPCMAPYCTSKFGLVGFSESLRSEVARLGVGVTCVCPAFVKTPIFETSPTKGLSGLDKSKVNKFWGQTPEKTARQIVQGVKRNKGLLVLTPEAKLLFTMKKFLPPLYSRIGLLTAKRLGALRDEEG